MPKSTIMRLLNITSFEEFLESRGIPLDDDRIPLLREFWNQGVESTIEYCARGGAHENEARAALMAT